MFRELEEKARCLLEARGREHAVVLDVSVQEAAPSALGKRWMATIVLADATIGVSSSAQTPTEALELAVADIQ